MYFVFHVIPADAVGNITHLAEDPGGGTDDFRPGNQTPHPPHPPVSPGIICLAVFVQGDTRLQTRR